MVISMRWLKQIKVQVMKEIDRSASASASVSPSTNASAPYDYMHKHQDLNHYNS